MDRFCSLALPESLTSQLRALGYETMTPIQAQALPILLEGRDLLAQAPTGSGKTVAFGIAAVLALRPEKADTTALILCPTRELATQVATVLRRIARCVPDSKILTLVGGVPFAPQLASLAHGAHAIVGTPGRIVQLLQQEVLNLDAVKLVILDEADKMLELGFEEELSSIIAALPQARQTLLFSATYTANILALANRYQSTPHHCRLTEALPDTLQAFAYCIPEAKRLQTTITLLEQTQPRQALLFCNTRASAEALHASLLDLGWSAWLLHGGMEADERALALVAFASEAARLLVATDLAARGLDIETVPMVVNYDMPEEHASYIHRAGRTARAGRSGTVYTLCTDAPPPEWLLHSLWEPPAMTPPAGPKLAPALVATHALVVLGRGKKDKLRAGDIVGALTAHAQVSASDIGIITLLPERTMIAIRLTALDAALAQLRGHPLKGRPARIVAICLRQPPLRHLEASSPSGKRR